MKKYNGITLIALVITIVVLLILVGVSITSITNDEGIVTKANEAKDKTLTAQEQEKSDISGIYDFIDENEKVDDNLDESFDNNLDNNEDDDVDIENSFADKIDASNYGDYVNYNKDLGLVLNLNGETSVPKTDWRIFCEYGERVYLISADYVPTTSSLLKVSNAGMTISGDYSLMWETAPTSLSTTLRKDSLFGITENGYVLNEANSNSRCVSTLLDTVNWSNFVDSNVADYAIGAPTLELFVNSWNSKGYTEITAICENTGAGYTLNGKYGYAQLYEDEIGYNDNLYFPHKNDVSIGIEDCVGYWIAAPFEGVGTGVTNLRNWRLFII